MKKNLYLLVGLFVSMLVFTACNDDDSVYVERIVISDGVLIVDEGNYYDGINGSMDVLNFSTGTVTRDVFEKVNGRAFGGTANNAVGVTVGSTSYIYVATTDENVIEVMDAYGYGAISQIQVPSPREMYINPGENYIYVTSYDGRVRMINILTRQVVKTSEVIGDRLEGITVHNGHVYVCNSYTPLSAAPWAEYHTNVIKLNATDLSKEKDITVTANPTSILTDGKDVYVLSMGNYGSISADVQKIDDADNVISLASATLMDYYDGKLYLVNAPWGSTPTCFTYDVESNVQVSFGDISEVKYPAAIGVDPATGEVFISSYSETTASGYAAADYSGDGYLVRYKNEGTKVAQYTVGVGPCTFLFYSHVEWRQVN